MTKPLDMNEAKLAKIMRERGIDLKTPETIAERAQMWESAMKIVLPPKDVSDRTTLRNIREWLVAECRAGRFNQRVVFRQALDFAIEAANPKSRNPAAVFVSILKKELGYRSVASKQ